MRFAFPPHPRDSEYYKALVAMRESWLASVEAERWSRVAPPTIPSGE